MRFIKKELDILQCNQMNSSFADAQIQILCLQHTIDHTIRLLMHKSITSALQTKCLPVPP